MLLAMACFEVKGLGLSGPLSFLLRPESSQLTHIDMLLKPKKHFDLLTIFRKISF